MRASAIQNAGREFATAVCAFTYNVTASGPGFNIVSNKAEPWINLRLLRPVLKGGGGGGGGGIIGGGGGGSRACAVC